MATLVPFRALRPPPERAAELSSPPYDVVSTEEARALASGGARRFLHVSRPEIDLPPGADPHGDEAHAAARRALDALRAEGALRQDPEPRLYVYAQTMGENEQTGVVGCASVEEYLGDVIKKHERTRADKEDDRARHVEVLGAHDEPVFLTYRARSSVGALVSAAKAGAPDFDFVSEDGVRQRLWVLGEAASLALSRAFLEVPAFYVADGHHRSAAAARAHARLEGAPGEHGVFLAVAFPHDELTIMAYNRLVRDLEGRSPEALLEAIGAEVDVELLPEGAPPEPPSPKSFTLYLGGRWYLLRVRPGTFDASDPVASLDCSLCQDKILGPVFGVSDPRRDAHVDFVGGIRGASELVRRVDGGAFTAAIHLYPTRIEELLEVSDAGRLMPPKSTWFEPKLRSGLFVHIF